MDALSLLLQDHERIRDLLESLTRTFSPQLRRRLLSQIRCELEKHSVAEETIFYPALENFGALTLQVKNSYIEHLQLRAWLDELMELPSGNEEFEIKLLRLTSLIEKHFAEEEDEIFPKVENLMTHSDRFRIGGYMEAMSSREMDFPATG